MFAFINATNYVISFEVVVCCNC